MGEAKRRRALIEARGHKWPTELEQHPLSKAVNLYSRAIGKMREGRKFQAHRLWREFQAEQQRVLEAHPELGHFAIGPDGRALVEVEKDFDNEFGNGPVTQRSGA